MKNIIEDYNQWLIEQDYNAMGNGVFLKNGIMYILVSAIFIVL